MEGLIIKEGEKVLRIREQILFHDASGLTFEFVVVDGDTLCPFRIRIYGDSVVMGNRELMFSPDGIIKGGGTFMGTSPYPLDKE
jgi:hypothetical protein